MRCIIYQGSIGNSGYGLDYDPDTQKTLSAHRLAFKQAYGYLPKVVMHTCDNKRCINPAHLRAGTQSENLKDAYNKGRAKPPLKIEEPLRSQIRASSGSSRKVATQYGIHQTTVLNIRKEISGHGGSCGS